MMKYTPCRRVRHVSSLGLILLAGWAVLLLPGSTLAQDLAGC